jgi:ADP-heptose:LPS heptosyltransferase
VFSILFYTAEDRIGDALIKLPTLLGLRQARPDIALTWATGTQASAYSKALAPLVGSVIREIHERTQLGTRWPARPHPLRARHFNCVIVSDKKIRSTLLLRTISHDRFIAPAVNFLFSDAKPSKPFGSTVAEQTLMLFELAINALIQPETRLPIPNVERELAAQLLPADASYIGFAPGAGGSEKCWPLERFIDVARAQQLRGRVPVFFLGPMESHWLEAIRSELPTALFPEYSATGASLGGPILTIALASHLTASVANDAGAGHLLAAGGRPLVSLFGRTDPAKFAPPYNKRTIISARQFGSTLVAAIPVGVVLQALDELCANQ